MSDQCEKCSAILQWRLKGKELKEGKNRVNELSSSGKWSGTGGEKRGLATSFRFQEQAKKKWWKPASREKSSKRAKRPPKGQPAKGFLEALRKATKALPRRESRK